MSHIIARAGAGVALALTATTLASPTAHAAVAAPSGLTVTPEGASVPALAWTPVAKATGYQVQVDNDSSFGSPEFTLSTVNSRATPTTALRSGTQFWRVRAAKGTETSDWRQGDPFTVSPISVPVPTAPAQGANLTQPDSPPLLQWQGSPAAASYTVEVDGDSDFVGSKSYSTKTTSLVVPDPLTVGDWFWRVTAVKGAGLVSLPSVTSTFNVLPLQQPVLTSPRDDITAAIEDVVLDWQPVAGARTYDVQIAEDQGFNTIAVSATNVQGTRYSPVVTTNSDQFWWRVRAVDLAGQQTPWTTSRFSFQRQWPQQPQLIQPMGTVATPSAETTTSPYYQWSPVPHASHYELYTANDPNFSINVDKCTTAGTTYVPRSDSDCGFHSSGTTYWQVRPMDLPYNPPGGLPGIFSTKGAFTWTGWAPTGTQTSVYTPVTGLKVSVGGQGAGCSELLCDGVPTTPVLTWDPQPGITSYQVYIAQDENFTTSVLAPKIPSTRNTKLALELPSVDQEATLPESQAGSAYYWYVRPCNSLGCGPSPVSSGDPDVLDDARAFRKASPMVTGLEASDPAGTEITFHWDDYFNSNLATSWRGETGVQSAKTYKIQVDSEPSFAQPLLDERVVDQATYTAFDRLYPEGTLYWRVQARDYSDNGLTWSETRSLTKESPAVQLLSPANGATASGSAPLRWSPQAFAASYTLEVYKNADRSFSAVNRLFSTTVKAPAYAWNQPIPADPTPYVWRVRRTDAEGNPGPWSTAYEFRSLGAAPVLTSPANGSWQPTSGTLFTWTDVPGAASYSLTATSASGSRIASVSTPGNVYATTKAIATGTYSWSVTAFDAGGKTLGTSSAASFRVDGTSPTVKSMKPTGSAKPPSVFAATFSEKVKGVSKRTMKLYQKGKKKPLKAKVVITKGGLKATLKPAARLKKGKTYLVKLTYSTIRDEAGNKLVKPKKWSVTVK